MMFLFCSIDRKKDRDLYYDRLSDLPKDQEDQSIFSSSVFNSCTFECVFMNQNLESNAFKNKNSVAI